MALLGGATETLMTTPRQRMHPQAWAMLERIAESKEPPLETLPPAEARRLADARVTRNGIHAAEMQEVRNRVIEGPGGPLRLRLYRPHSTRILPLTMFFHGGGFMVANLDTHDALCRTLAERSGSAFLAVDYRLAPEHKFPAAPEDCIAATRWALTHGDELGVDASRIALVGESSGGNLAAVVAQALAREAAPALRLQALTYAAFDMSFDSPSYREFSQGYFFTKAKSEYFMRHYLRTPEDADDPRASPLRAASLQGVCPALIITAGLDPLLSEAEAYAKRLWDADISVEYRCFDRWPHGFLFWGETEAAKQSIDLISQALARALDA
jgi:acetyl esterase